MSLLNDILSFFIKRRTKHIEEFIMYPIETQRRVFDELIQDAKQTEWGTTYQYRSIRSIQEFQERVPISTYEELYPYIERTLKGERNLLWPSEVKWFAKSSGTTNARSKFIPITEESLEECHYKGGKDLMTLYINNRPDNALFDGKGLSISGSMHVNPYNNATVVGDVSAIIMQNLPTWAEYLRTPSIEVALLDKWEDKLDKMIEICSKEDVRSILGVPTWTLVLLENIVKRAGVSNILEIWPNFELFVHGAVSFTPYRELFEQKIFPSSQVSYLETYNASEGFFAIQDDLDKTGEMLLMLDYGIFYEFIPMEEWDKEQPKTLTLEEVELGKNYALVISTNAGLWRYKIGDTIRFTSLEPFRIKVSGRTKHFINAFGEELIIENAEMGIAEACKQVSCVVNDFTAAPIFMSETGKGGHEWVIEFDEVPYDKDAFTIILDTTLRRINSDYDAKRYKNIALLMPKIHFVEKGTFYRWMQKRGKLGGQNKVPRLANNREFLDDLLQMIYN